MQGVIDIVFLVNWIHEHNSSDKILRTEPADGGDFQPNKHTKILSNEGPDKSLSFRRARLPVCWANSEIFNGYRGRTPVKCRTILYSSGFNKIRCLFLGCGVNATLVLLLSEQGPRGHIDS